MTSVLDIANSISPTGKKPYLPLLALHTIPTTEFFLRGADELCGGLGVGEPSHMVAALLTGGDTAARTRPQQEAEPNLPQRRRSRAGRLLRQHDGLRASV